MEYLREIECKRMHDHDHHSHNKKKIMEAGRRSLVWVEGAVIVGAGPSGLAAAACLKQKGIPSLILEKSHCLASMWQLKTYDRLRLHLPKRFCQLPLFPMPSHFPSYPSKHQFLSYLHAYALSFHLNPLFGTTVTCAEYDNSRRCWRIKVTTTSTTNSRRKSTDIDTDTDIDVTEYGCRWLVVASGENAEEVMPQIEGMGEFRGPIIHSSGYKSGDMFCGKDVLVVGCGNSGMEVCLDLSNHNARPSLVVRDTVYIYFHTF